MMNLLLCRSRMLMGLFVFLCLLQTAFAAKTPTICLNMIVKNESAVICRCLESVKPIIDYWVIVDTGSSDGTQDIIREYMKDIPGEVHDLPWKNFAHNRNEALELAKSHGDYLLFIDADETLVFSPEFSLPNLDQDCYYIPTHARGTQYGRVQLISNRLGWRWEGVLHEYLDADSIQTIGTLSNVHNFVRCDGTRSQDPQKYHKDAALLEQALIEDPTNCRYVFYLAQSYRDAGEMEKALESYKKRLAMGGWDQELFWSKLQIAQIQEALKYPSEKIVEGYTEAYQFRKNRAEPLYRLATYHRLQEQYEQGYRAAYQGLTLSTADDILFVERWIYDWGLLLEYSICAYWTERFAEAYLASSLLLCKKDLPDTVKDCLENNMKWINEKIASHRI